MKKIIIAAVVLLLLPVGCATIADKSRIEEYENTMDGYESAMRLSDFNAACQFVDPAVISREACLARYENLKLTSYDVLEMKPSNNNHEVNQSVAIEYYFLDRHVVEKIQHKQQWRYQEDAKVWMLQTGPPRF
jgi:hypothetical protein